MTIDLIMQSQGGNRNATCMLIEKFNPLLKKYAYNDLLLDFIELLHTMQIKNIHNKSEGGVVSYISTAVI